MIIKIWKEQDLELVRELKESLLKNTVTEYIDEIVENLLNNLVLERFMNKQNPEVNWNNVRYFEKEERDKKMKNNVD